MRRAGAVVAVVLALALPAAALEPVTLSVEGRVPVDESARAPRDRALREAMLEAVLEASRPYLPAALLEVEEEQAWLRDRLRSRAEGFILTYRIDGPLERRPVERQPGAVLERPLAQEWVLPVTATVDLSEVRSYLEESGLLAAPAEQPSVALRVHLVEGLDPAQAAAPLADFEAFLLRRFEAAGLVVVEPALRPGGLKEPEDALDLARALGADLAVDVAVRWRERSGARVPGGTAEVRLRALRVQDGSDVALARFEAPAYHADRQEALVRALQALGEQVVQNFELQLERNWQILSADEGPLALTLVDVSSLLQVDAVRDALAAALGAEEVELVALSPHTARIRVEAPFSPGALQDRLAAVRFEDFRLEPLEVAAGRVSLRVAVLPGLDPNAPASPEAPAR